MYLEILNNLTNRAEIYAYYKKNAVAINRELQQKAAKEASDLRQEFNIFSTSVQASQTDLAGVLELSQSEISRIKNGQRNLSPEVADRLRMLLVRR
jgi:hypothetical protein